MDAFVGWQRLVTVSVGTAGGQVVQTRANWLDTLVASKVSIHVEIFLLDGGGGAGMSFYLETANSDEGPWTVLETWTGGATGTSVDEVIDLEAHYAALCKLQRFVRWRVNNPAGAQRKVSFRLRCKTAGQQQQLPMSHAGSPWAEFVQDWVTVHFHADDTDLVQDQEEWIDCEGMESFAAMLQTPVMSGVTFSAETAPTPEGPWSNIGGEATAPVGDAAAEYSGVLFANRRSDAPRGNRLERYVRWHLTGDAGGAVCFRIRAVLRR